MHRGWLAIIGVAALGPAVPATAGTYSLLYQFGSDPSATGFPENLVALPSGSLVGVAQTAAYATFVFKLDPPATGNGAWTYSIIYDLRNFPVRNQFFNQSSKLLLADAAGNLYGATDPTATLDSGTFYRLSPPPSGLGSWNCTVVYYHFSPSGTNYIPMSLVYLNHTGRQLYGTAFFFSPPNFSVSLFRLNLPDPAVTGEAANLSVISPDLVSPPNGSSGILAVVPALGGAFYGVDTSPGYETSGIFRVTPPGPGATQGRLQSLATTVPGGASLYSQSLAVDLSDRITGVGGGGTYGTIWRLSPPTSPGSAWQGSVIYSFKGAAGQDGSTPTQILSHNGLFYGLTAYGGRATSNVASTSPDNGFGTLFELAAPPAGSTTAAWSELAVHKFAGQGATDGQYPIVLTQATASDGTYALYGITQSGGSANMGTIFRYVP